MAYVKIITVRSKNGIKNTTKYVENKEKTDEANRENYVTKEQEGIDVGEENGTIDDVIDYTSNPKKTEHKQLVTGINCTVEGAADEMRELADYWKKERRIDPSNTRDLYHIIQSFDPRDNDKLTPQMVHDIGIEFAKSLQQMDDKKIVDRKYMMLVCTHVDKEHLHNHIVLCPFDIESGKKFHECKDVYRQMKDKSDDLCYKYGLHVIEDPDRARKSTWYEKDMEKKGISWKDKIRKDIESTRSIAKDWKTFKTYMESAGYEVRDAGKYVTYVDEANHHIREERLGRDYTKESMEKGWEEEAEKRRQLHELLKGRPHKGKTQEEKDAYDPSSRIGLYDEDGRRRSMLEILILTAIEDLQTGGLAGISGHEGGPATRVNIRDLKDAETIAKESQAVDMDDLNAKLNRLGKNISHYNLELKKCRATINKMRPVNGAFAAYESVKDRVEDINRTENAEVKAGLQKEYADEIETYKKSKSTLYRSRCSTPEQIEDFRKRYKDFQDRVSILTSYLREQKRKYARLAKLKSALEASKDPDFMAGKKTMNKPEETPEEKDRATEISERASKRITQNQNKIRVDTRGFSEEHKRAIESITKRTDKDPEHIKADLEDAVYAAEKECEERQKQKETREKNKDR